MPGIYVPGVGPANPQIVLVGESPSYVEEQTLTPFTGPSGKLLNELLHDAGINRADCWITNVSKFFVPPKIPFSIRAHSVGIDINKCINELRIELNQLQPNVVVALGATALWALTGKSR